jgi:hypothetical protein
MTKRERSSWPDRRSLERSREALLDALLEGGPWPDGGPLPDGAPPQWRPVAHLLTALTSAPERCELTGEAQALAEFRGRPHPVRRPGPVRHRGPGWVPWLRGPRPAVAAAAGAVLVGGLLAVAYAGDLPAAAQRLAHDTIDAPPVARSGSAAPDPDASQLPALPLGTAAGRAGFPLGRGAGRPDRRTSPGFLFMSPYHHRRPGSAPGTGSGPSGRSGDGHQFPSGSPAPSGLPSQSGLPSPSGSPSGSPTPSASQQPSPSASDAPVAAATPSPWAAPGATRPSGHHHRTGTSGAQSPPP